jgi:hypothetical protein
VSTPQQPRVRQNKERQETQSSRVDVLFCSQLVVALKLHQYIGICEFDSAPLTRRNGFVAIVVKYLTMMMKMMTHIATICAYHARRRHVGLPVCESKRPQLFQFRPKAGPLILYVPVQDFVTLECLLQEVNTEYIQVLLFRPTLGPFDSIPIQDFVALECPLLEANTHKYCCFDLLSAL